MKRNLIFLMLGLLLVCGCAAPLEVHRFQPVADPPNITVITKANEAHLRYAGEDYDLSAVLFEARGVFIISLTITNKTNSWIKAKDYSIGLYDGRDLKPLKQFARKDIISFKVAFESGKPIRTGEPAVDAALSTIVQVFSPSSRAEVIKSLDKAIDDYFSFRPLYPKETREGILCYHADFRLEYPLSLMVKIKDKTIAFRWWPIPKKSASSKT